MLNLFRDINCWCFDHRLLNLASRSSVARWLTNEDEDLDWFGFGQQPYVQCAVVFFAFLTLECRVLTIGCLQAVYPYVSF
jgi:hypothetical protein